MGNTPSVDAPKVQTSRQPAQRPQNERPIFAGVLGEAAKAIGPHDEASSLTVTPRLEDTDSAVRTAGTAKTYSRQRTYPPWPGQMHDHRNRAEERARMGDPQSRRRKGRAHGVGEQKQH